MKFKNKHIPILILFAITPTAGSAFPDLIRKGYTSCLSCHVSPAGGGVLTSYGRGVSSELATFRYEGAGEFAGIPYLDKIKDPTLLFSNLKGNIQAEWRQVNIRLDREGSLSQYVTVPMQASVEGAVHVGETTDIVGSYGKYGPLNQRQFRTHYIQARTSQYLSLRGGRFLPAYGLNIDDHTAFIRSASGISQGKESVNLEAHFESEIASATFTRTFGQKVLIEDSGDKFEPKSDQPEALIFRATAKLSPRHYVGASYYYDKDKAMYSGFLGSAPIKDLLYFLAEYSSVKALDLPAERLVYLRVGSELYHGIVLNYDYQARLLQPKNSMRHGISLQLMLVPHSELRLEARLEEETMSYLMMSHLWL